MTTDATDKILQAWSTRDGAFSWLALASTVSIAVSIGLLMLAVELAQPVLVVPVNIAWLAVIALHVWLAIEHRRYVKSLEQFISSRWGSANIGELKWLRSRASQMAREALLTWLTVVLVALATLVIRYVYAIPEMISVLAINMVVSAIKATSQVASRKIVWMEVDRVRHLSPACRISV